MILINREEYWQCAYVIEKGGFEEIQKNGLENFRKQLAPVSPFLTDRMAELKNWDDIKLLSVDIDHLEKWYDEGLLCIGDAAHAMSPIGGVGINLAIQDAVAAANILYPHLSKLGIDIGILKEVQSRREWPTRVVQRVQVVIQNIISKGRGQPTDIEPPLPLRLLNRFPILRRIPARLVGLGIRPEHVRTPDANDNVIS
jgi:2-polyprenyl-6-methoxyphenol hydroxylase-like FAD-dependent oxidoreductase